MNIFSRLMGSFSGELLKGYKADTSVSDFKAGLNNIWTIKSAKRTSNGEECSIMTCTKQSIKETLGGDITDLEPIWKVIQAEAKNLLCMKHPSLLKVLDKIHQDENQISVVVERIQGTLATIFQEIYTFVGENPEKEFEGVMDSYEVKLNIKMILTALRFINKDLKKCHFGVSPEIIFFTEGAKKWKMGGFGLMKSFGISNSQNEIVPINPNLYFVSPEHFDSVNNRSDLFSFGLVLVKLFIYISHLQNSNF